MTMSMRTVGTNAGVDVGGSGGMMMMTMMVVVMIVKKVDGCSSTLSSSRPRSRSRSRGHGPGPGLQLFLKSSIKCLHGGNFTWGPGQKGVCGRRRSHGLHGFEGIVMVRLSLGGLLMLGTGAGAGGRSRGRASSVRFCYCYEWLSRDAQSEGRQIAVGTPIRRRSRSERQDNRLGRCSRP